MTDDAIVCIDLTKRYSGPPPAPPNRWGAGPPLGPPADRNTAATRGVAATIAPPEPAAGILAVDRLNLRIPTGEFFGLLGPNGAGKSTTIGMLTTRVMPTSGQAFVAGIDVVAAPALARTRLAAVTQTNTLDRSLTLFDNLYFHGRYFGLSRAESRRRAQALLERFELQDRANVLVDTLSGGLAQRVQIARALLHDPEVLFLDEPTAGLDPQSRVQLWDALGDLNKAGQTIVLTTHYMEEADRLCDRIAIIDHGRLLALDTPQGLKDTVAADRVITATLAAPDDGSVTAALRATPGIDRVEVDARTVRVYAQAMPGLVGAVVHAVAQADAELRDLAVAEPTLETVFLTLTGKEYRE
jgi:ABC-2 type transport system ATP-binding protein